MFGRLNTLTLHYDFNGHIFISLEQRKINALWMNKTVKRLQIKIIRYDLAYKNQHEKSKFNQVKLKIVCELFHL